MAPVLSAPCEDWNLSKFCETPGLEDEAENVWEGHRATRAWNKYGVEGSAELIIKLSWETALAMGYEEQCARLLLLDSTEAAGSWKLKVVHIFKVLPQ